MVLALEPPISPADRYVVQPSPIGDLLLTGNAEQLMSLWFWGTPTELPKELQLDSSAFPDVRQQLNEYFAAERTEFHVRLAPVGAGFNLRVWSALLTVPYGQTASYGEIARQLGQPGAAFVGGIWVDGPLGPPATLPSGIDSAEVRGLQFVFTNSSGAGISPGAQATVALELEQTEAVVDAPKPLIVTNTAQSAVLLGDQNQTSAPASDDYRVPPAEVAVGASKNFTPDSVKAGDPSAVTLGATNLTNNVIDSLTIIEPAGDSDPFNDGLTFTGLGNDNAGGGIVWPRGATEASIVYSCGGAADEPLTTITVDTLPAPPAGCDQVTGFTVTFAGAIAQGAEATVPFGVITDADQDVDTLVRSNTINVIGKLGSIEGNDTATDEITSYADRLAV